MRDNSTIIEANNDTTATWLTSSNNLTKLCEKLNPCIKFQARNYKIIAYNAPIDLDPNNTNHITEICKSNNIDTKTTVITSVNWAKAIGNQSPNQRTAHLYLTFRNAKAANRAVTNGLVICNKKCQTEKSRQEL